MPSPRHSPLKPTKRSRGDKQASRRFNNVFLSCFGCTVLIGWLVFYIWSIAALSTSGDLIHSGCRSSDAWWTMLAMVITFAMQLVTAPLLRPPDGHTWARPRHFLCSLRGILAVLVLLGSCGATLFVAVFGARAWLTIDAECKQDVVDNHNNIWLLFQIAVVLALVSSTVLLCVVGGVVWRLLSSDDEPGSTAGPDAASEAGSPSSDASGETSPMLRRSIDEDRTVNPIFSNDVYYDGIMSPKSIDYMAKSVQQK